jgi:hypothetical protein
MGNLHMLVDLMDPTTWYGRVDDQYLSSYNCISYLVKVWRQQK